MILDLGAEVLAVLRRNPLRTVLTAFGVCWGLLMLILLLGFGEGLEAVAVKNFARSSTNSVFFWGGRTTMPYKGYRSGRRIAFRMADFEAASQVPGIDQIAARVQLGGWRSGNIVTVGTESGSYNVMGEMPEYFDITPVVWEGGRFLNVLDLEEQRKVAVIGTSVKEELFRGKDPLGQAINIQGVHFIVVGVLRSSRGDERGDRENSTIHIPLSTFQKAFNMEDRIGWILLTARPEIAAGAMEDRVRSVFMERHGVHPKDVNAIRGWNAQEEMERIANLFLGIRWFVWFVGAATLLSGVVGVSNIMLVIVRERTKEIGLRRALGATRMTVVIQIVSEALILTLLAGWVGLMGGVALVEGVAAWLGPDHELVGSPRVDASAALIALVVLVAAGVFSGLLPARRAARIHPVEALRSE
ncbi:MAG: ABC transporter permease [Deltaproteobacteria bacterium]|nr:MAG: ABC transporter permease [Deltaproteobacteria bacterium]